MIRLTGTLDASHAAQTVRHALPAHIAASRAEPGCLSFEVHEDPARPALFHVSETFINRAAFEAHQARTKASDWGRITAGCLRTYEIETVS